MGAISDALLGRLSRQAWFPRGLKSIMGFFPIAEVMCALENKSIKYEMKLMRTFVSQRCNCLSFVLALCMGVFCLWRAGAHVCWCQGATGLALPSVFFPNMVSA